MENNTSIETLIENSLKEFLDMGIENDTQQKTKSRLIFPRYYSRGNAEDKRISEQELRFTLVRKLENESDFYYSVEAPTKKKYAFEGSKENSRSGSIDLCLHDSNGERTNLIEFKNKGGISDISKDLEKLLFDLESANNYFVHLDSSKSKSADKIHEEYKMALEEAKENSSECRPGEKIIANVTIFLFVISTGELHKYEINKKGQLNKVDG